MQQRSFLILSTLTLAAVAAAAFSLRGRGDSGVEAGSRPLFPDLEERINDVARITVEKGDQTLTVERREGDWILTATGYPAKFDPVKRMVVRLAGLEIEEKKTARPENHARLALEWPATAEEGSEAAEAARVTLADASGAPMADLIVGKSEWRGSKPQVFVRRADEDQVYLCRSESGGNLDVIPDAKQWIETKFVELAKDRVQSVVIDHADGEHVEIGRSATDHTKFALENVPPGRIERYAGVADGLGSALAYGLTLEDVRPVSEVDFEAEPLARTRFRTHDGLELTLELARFEEQAWVRVAAAHVPPAERPEPVGPEPEDEQAEADASTPEEPERDPAAEAAELNARLSPWAFELSSYRVDQLARRMDELLNEIEPPPEDSLESLMEGFGVDPATGEEHDHGPGDEHLQAPEDAGLESGDPIDEEGGSPPAPDPEEPR